jgi:hypothetical protein
MRPAIMQLRGVSSQMRGRVKLVSPTDYPSARDRRWGIPASLPTKVS